MEGPAECYVVGPLALALRISKLVGLAPLEFVKTEKGWRVSLSPRLYVYGCIAVIFANVAIICAVVYEIMMYPQNNLLNTVMRRVAWVMRILMVEITWTIMVFRSSDHMRCMIASLDQVQKIISNLNILQWPLQWKKKQIGLILFCVIICQAVSLTEAVVLFRFQMAYASVWIRLAYLVYFAYFWLIELGLLLFVLVVLHVQRGFKAVNYCLEKLLREMNEQQAVLEKHILKATINTFKRTNNYVKDNITNSLSYHETIHRIVLAYVTVCDAMRDVNSSYGLMLIMFLSSTFLHLVIMPYYFIANLVAERNMELPNLTMFITKQFLQFSWIVSQATNLSMAIEPCHSTHTEMERTRELVSRLMVRAHSMYDPVAVELEQFCVQLTLNDMYFKPLHITTMTRGLVLTFLGSISTYLVILVDYNN